MKYLNELSEPEFIEELQKNYYLEKGKFTFIQRLNVIRQIWSLFKYTYNHEQIAFLICNYPRVITEACAGAGKTRTTIMKLWMHVLFGDVEPQHALMISYTTKSTFDLQTQYEAVYDTLRSVKAPGLNVSGGVRIMTMYSFFDELIYEYASILGVDIINRSLKIYDKYTCLNMLQDVIKVLMQKGRLGISYYDSLPSSLLSLYGQIKEKDIYNDTQEWEKCSSFKSVKDIPLEQLQEVYEVYEKIKRANRGLELCEYPSFATKALSIPNVLERWQKMYQMIAIDEYQDVTEASVSFFKKLLIEGASDNSLFAIGDGDQSIYDFRGATTNGCYKFPEVFGGNLPVAACQMTINRRCPDAVLNEARKIIESCSVRVPKVLRSLKQGGNVFYQDVTGSVDEANQVREILSKFSAEDLKDTVVAYRSNRVARLIKQVLEDAHYRVITNSDPTDTFESSLIGCINLLAEPYNMELSKKHLYKLLPKSKGFTKADILRTLSMEAKSRANGSAMKAFYQLSYDGVSMPQSFNECMRYLRTFSKCLNQDVEEKYLSLIYMDKIVPAMVFNYLRKYYLEWQDTKMDTEGGEHIFVPDQNKFADPSSAKLFAYYSQHMTWEQFKVHDAMRLERIANSRRQITLSTFHSLKGLEFKNVILTGLQDAIFPGYEIQEATKFGPQYIIQVDDEAKRLLYVAMTRSKSDLYLLFDSNNPTRYKSLLQPDDYLSDQDTTGEFDFTTLDNAEAVTLNDSPVYPANPTALLLDDLDQDPDEDPLQPEAFMQRWLTDDA